jgi:hypothetical protein
MKTDPNTRGPIENKTRTKAVANTHCSGETTNANIIFIPISK